MAERFIKTRIAPTPSGYLHLGNVLSFSLTAALARQAGAAILLRIDDLDRERVTKEYVDDIFQTLEFLDIPWDEGPRNMAEYERVWSQVHRLPLYREALQQLKENGRLFACDCSRSKIWREAGDGGYPGTCRDRGLSLDAADCSWRIRTEGAATTVDGMREALPVEMSDFVVRKKDGYPAYQLTSVVDDLYFGIDLVVRGEDLRASTAAQRWLAAELGRPDFRQIRFIHHPLLLDAGMEKLSKSAGSQSVRFLRRQGVKPAEIYSMIARRFGVEIPVENWQELAGAITKVRRY